MKKLINLINTTKKQIKNLDLSNDSRVVRKAFFFSNLILIIMLIPFVLIFIEFFKQYSIITPMFYILLFFIFLILYFILPLSNVIYFELLKNYLEREEVTIINLKHVYLTELFNIFNCLIPLGIVIVIYVGLRLI